MKVDPRFALAVTRSADWSGLVVTAKEVTKVAEALPSLFSAAWDELLELAGAPPEWREASRDRRRRGIFSNGWQTWSFAGELFRGERIRRAWLIGALNTIIYRHGQRDGRNVIVSQLFTHVRVGAGRLILVSRGPSPDKAGAPVAFRIDRRDLGVEVEAFAGGGSYEAGAVVAEIRLAWRVGFFAERDFLKESFADRRRLTRLAFLANKEGLVPGGYESWYNHYTAISEEILRAELAALGSNGNLINSYYLSRGKPTVFQVDDGWEAAIGDWVPHPTKFPRGLKGLARDIEAAGLVPGLWVSPFIVTPSSRTFAEKQDWLLRDGAGKPVVAGWNNFWEGDFYALDLSIPEVEGWLAGTFDRIVDDWGFRYLKLDFLYAGLLEGKRRFGGSAWEHYDRVVSRITGKLADKEGRRVAWLGCGAPLESSFRAFPLMRIGADTKEAWEYKGARLIRFQGRAAAGNNLNNTITRSVLDGALFVNDPDVVFCREKGIEHGEREKELIALVARLLASQLMFSDSASEFGSQGEAAFTARLVGLYDRLAGREFGAERVELGIFAISSRDGLVVGWINLRGRPYRLRDRQAAAVDPEAAIVSHARRIGGGLVLEPRSISLFESRGRTPEWPSPSLGDPR